MHRKYLKARHYAYRQPPLMSCSIENKPLPQEQSVLPLKSAEIKLQNDVLIGGKVSSPPGILSLPRMEQQGPPPGMEGFYGQFSRQKLEAQAQNSPRIRQLSQVGHPKIQGQPKGSCIICAIKGNCTTKRSPSAHSI